MMGMWTTKQTAVLAAAALVALTACAQGEDDADDLDTVPPAAEQPGLAPTTGFTDASVTRVLDVINTGEIAEAQIAVSKSQNADVKRFAEMMIRDHEQMKTETRSLSGAPAGDTGAAPTATGTTPATGHGTTGSPGAPATGHGATTTPNTAPGNTTIPPASGTAPPASSMPMPQDHMMAGTPETIIQQLQQESESVRTSWQNLSGAAFDRAYMERQVTAHQNALDMVDRQLLPGTQGAELRQALTNARPIIQRHLDEARRIQQSLGAGTTTR